MSAREPILICGGGLGGLTTALALARRGRPSRVLEGAAEFGANGLDATVAQINNSISLKAGTLRGIAVTGKARWKDFSDIPTVAEQGLADFEVISWSGLAAPARTPPPVLDRLHAEIERALKVPDVRSRLESFGAEVRSTTSAEMRDLVARQIALWTRVANEAGIRHD